MHLLPRFRLLLYAAFICLILAFLYLNWLTFRPSYSRSNYPHCSTFPKQQSLVAVTAQPTCGARDTMEPSPQTTGYNFLPSSSGRLSITISGNGSASTVYSNCSNPTGDQEILNWSFNAQRDAQSYGLSSMQCSKAFRELFKELDRAITHQKSIGRISPADIDINWVKRGAVKALIYNGQVSTLIHSTI